MSSKQYLLGGLPILKCGLSITLSISYNFSIYFWSFFCDLIPYVLFIDEVSCDDKSRGEGSNDDNRDVQGGDVFEVGVKESKWNTEGVVGMTIKERRARSLLKS